MIPVRWLTNRSRTRVKRLQVELFGRLRRHELHRWPLDSLGDRLRIAEVILLPLGVGPHILHRHQSGIVTKRLELPTEMMRTDTRLHADQTPRHIGKPCFDLAARPLLTQHDRTTRIHPDDVERVLPISMPITATE